MATYQEYYRKISSIERKLDAAESGTERIRNELLSPKNISGSKSADNLNDTLDELLKRIKTSKQKCANAKQQLRKD